MMITSLPIDLITDILLRLPAKTLVRLKIVCKSLYNLISDNDFTNCHLERSISTKTNLHYVVTTPKLYLQECDHLPKPLEINCPVLYSADFDSFDNPVELSHPFKNCKSGIWVIGSCRGLLLVHVSNGLLLLYNPTTQTYNVLPLMSEHEPPWGTYVKHDYGFGYDSVSKDFKCVRIMQCGFREEEYLSCEVMVYSMKMNCWKRVVDVPCYFRTCGWNDGMLSHEICHWVGTNADEVYEPIVAFSLRDETFSRVALPNVCLDHNDTLYLGTVDDCLCLLVNNIQLCTVWLMKEYGVLGSWTRTYSIVKDQSHDLERPISFSSGKKRLLVKKSYCMLCFVDLEKPMTSLFSNLTFTGWDKGLDAHVYVENLLILEFNEFAAAKDQQGKTKNKRRKRRNKKRVLCYLLSLLIAFVAVRYFE